MTHQPASGIVANTYLVSVQIADLVFDPGLQARVGMNEAAIADYSEAMKNGTKFPPGHVMEVEGRLLVTDGWHRAYAWERAHPSVPYEVIATVGTYREAMLAAARANATHGLPRTHADKRRAVQLLLKDDEACQLSNREIATSAVVSHTFVANVRKEYGVKQGELLTEARVEHVDGVPSPEWRELLERVPDYHRGEVERIRRLEDPRDLARISEYGDLGTARNIRRQELARDPWPWADGPEDRQIRADVLDTEDEIVAAVRAKDCPSLAALYDVLGILLTLKNRSWGWDELIKAWEPRRKLAALAREYKSGHDAAEEKRRATDPHWQARRVSEIADPKDQAYAIRGLSAEAVQELDVRRLTSWARDTALRERVGSSADCPRPACQGWVWKRHYNETCVRCFHNPDNWLSHQRHAVASCNDLLNTDTHAIRIGDLVLDRRSLAVLRALQSEPLQTDEAWIRAAPAAFRTTLGAWLDASSPVTVIDPHAPKVAEDGDEVDAEEDDAGDAGDGVGDEE